MTQEENKGKHVTWEDLLAFMQRFDQVDDSEEKLLEELQILYAQEDAIEAASKLAEETDANQPDAKCHQASDGEQEPEDDVATARVSSFAACFTPDETQNDRFLDRQIVSSRGRARIK